MLQEEFSEKQKLLQNSLYSLGKIFIKHDNLNLAYSSLKRTFGGNISKGYFVFLRLADEISNILLLKVDIHHDAQNYLEIFFRAFTIIQQINSLGSRVFPSIA